MLTIVWKSSGPHVFSGLWRAGEKKKSAPFYTGREALKGRAIAAAARGGPLLIRMYYSIKGYFIRVWESTVEN